MQCIVWETALPASGSIALEIAPREVAPGADQSFVQAIRFESVVLLDDSQLLELSPTPIDFPAEDSDIVVLARSYYNGANGATSAIPAQTKFVLAGAAPFDDRKLAQ